MFPMIPQIYREPKNTFVCTFAEMVGSIFGIIPHPKNPQNFTLVAGFYPFVTIYKDRFVWGFFFFRFSFVKNNSFW